MALETLGYEKSSMKLLSLPGSSGPSTWTLAVTKKTGTLVTETTSQGKNQLLVTAERRSVTAVSWRKGSRRRPPPALVVACEAFAAALL
jgi:hypothetical protein